MKLKFGYELIKASFRPEVISSGQGRQDKPEKIFSSPAGIPTHVPRTKCQSPNRDTNVGW